MLHEITTIKFLGILLVVSGHVGGVFNIIGIPWINGSEIFPAYSFHMPLFFFASGYFYKIAHEKNISSLIKKRFSSLVIPYYKWNLFYGILVSILIAVDLFDNGNSINLYNLFIAPWTSGYQFNLNGPSWFVLCLFVSQILYIVSRNIFSKLIDLIDNLFDIKDANKEYIYTIIFILFGLLSTYISIYYEILDYSLLYIFVRSLFSIQFLHFGYIYNNFIKDKIIININTFFILILSKIIFIDTFKNYTFSMRALVFRDELILPIITSLFGILYMIHLVKFINSIINKFNLKFIENTIYFISNNTWSIMMHHMLFNYILENFFDNFLYFTTVSFEEFFDFFIIPFGCVVLSVLLPILLKNICKKVIPSK